MPTSKSVLKPAAPATSRTKDAIPLLIADHKEVKGLFKANDKLVKAAGDNGEKEQLASRNRFLLTVHATVEEELFYPAARGVLGADQALIAEAVVEHTTAKELIAQLESSSFEGPPLDTKVKVFGDYIDHYVKEEETEMFPKVKQSALDLKALGAEMAARKEFLMTEFVV